MAEKHVPKHRAPKRSLFSRPAQSGRSGTPRPEPEPGPSRTVSIVEPPPRTSLEELPAPRIPDAPAAARRMAEAPAAARPVAEPARATSPDLTPLARPRSTPTPGDDPEADFAPMRSSEDYFDALAASNKAASRAATNGDAHSTHRAAPVRTEPVHRTEEFVLPELQPPDPEVLPNGSSNGSYGQTDASPLSIKSAIKGDGKAWDPFLRDDDPEPEDRTFGPAGIRAGLDRMRPRRRVRPIQPVTPDERHDHQTLGQWLKEILILGLIAILTAVLLTNYVVQAFFIPSESMEDTLLINDRVLVNKVVYNIREPKPGDIVVFTSPDRVSVDEENQGPFADALNEAAQGLGLRSSVQDLIKRVVAVEGQTVEVKIGSLFVDGKQVDEPYRKDFLPMPNFGPVTVPEGKVFVMGDNRSQSHDSRAFGAIDKETIVGRAFALIWPVQRFTWLKTA